MSAVVQRNRNELAPKSPGDARLALVFMRKVSFFGARLLLVLLAASSQCFLLYAASPSIRESLSRCSGVCCFQRCTVALI